MQHEQIAILGLGLIGGSLALALKKRKKLEIIGYDHSKSVLKRAQERKVVDRVTSSLQEAVQEADYIFLAMPVQAIESTIQMLSKLDLKQGCIISDVGSTKKTIMEAAAQTLARKGVSFIGGHPMKGSHQSGLDAAEEHLFHKARWILTPSAQTSMKTLHKLCRFLHEGLEAEIVVLEAEHHDQVLAAVSHLPHLVASTLSTVVGSCNEQAPYYYQIAGPGYRDTTRVAASDPIMWRDIFKTNRRNILDAINTFIAELQRIRQRIADGQSEEIVKWLTCSQHYRQAFVSPEDGLPLSEMENPLFVLALELPISKLWHQLKEAKCTQALVYYHAKTSSLAIYLPDQEERAQLSLALHESIYCAKRM